MKKIVSAVLCVIFVSAVAFAAPAKTPTSKTPAKQAPAPVKNGGNIAIGYTTGFNDQFENIALRFCANDLVAMEALFGFGVGDGDNLFGFGAKVLFNLKKYSSFNVYGFGEMGLGIISPEHGDSTTVFGIKFGAGVEYFLAKNLSVSSELGLGGAFAKNNNRFGTLGDWASNLGFRYYFD